MPRPATRFLEAAVTCRGHVGLKKTPEKLDKQSEVEGSNQSTHILDRRGLFPELERGAGGAIPHEKVRCQRRGDAVKNGVWPASLNNGKGRLLQKKFIESRKSPKFSKGRKGPLPTIEQGKLRIKTSFPISPRSG